MSEIIFSFIFGVLAVCLIYGLAVVFWFLGAGDGDFVPEFLPKFIYYAGIFFLIPTLTLIGFFIYDNFYSSLGLLIAPVSIVIFYWKILKSKNSQVITSAPATKEKSLKETIDKFDALSADQLLKMTTWDISKATGASWEGVMRKLEIEGKRCKDFDGTKTSKERVLESEEAIEFGALQVKVVCSYCKVSGLVRKTENVERFSSTKSATSLLGPTGPNSVTSKRVTQMHCDNCDMTWDL